MNVLQQIALHDQIDAEIQEFMEGVQRCRQSARSSPLLSAEQLALEESRLDGWATGLRQVQEVLRARVKRLGGTPESDNFPP